MSDLLSGFVTRAAAKRLRAVEASPVRSNQHEFNGVTALRTVFGDVQGRRQATFVHLSETEADLTTADGFVTWYDAREEHPTRSEYRLYFPRTDASEKLREGDLALFLLRPNDSVLIAFAHAGTTAEQQLLWLFRLNSPDTGVEVTDIREADTRLGFAAREILEQLGIEAPVGPSSHESFFEILIDRFGEGFPTTAEFSEFARSVTDGVDPVGDPDGALIAWLEREEALFRHLEGHLILDRLRVGFSDDVDAFVQFSLSVQNRRKSRVGYAFENHVQAILEANGVPYSRTARTERNSRPDFILPSIEAYRDPSFPSARLVMLGVKSTCKERWRQVLAEADRVTVKHLLTLEPGISTDQTDEMTSRKVVLVVPREIQTSFKPSQREGMLTVAGFLSQLR